MKHAPAFQLYHQNRFPEAERAFSRALAEEPSNASLFDMRGRMRLLQGDWAGADEDLRCAAELTGFAVRELERWLQVLLHRGDEDRLRDLLEKETLDDAGREFWRGCLASRAGKQSKAAAHFAASERAGRAEAGLFRWAAWARGQAAQSPVGSGVDVVGLGYRKVFQMSVGAISALHGARRLALVGNVLDDLVLRLLGLFPVPISFLVFRGTEKEASRGARSVVDSAARERTALVTRGHPLVFGLLAGLIVEKTAASGVPCRVWDGVSGFDELPALCGPSGAKSRGFQVAGAFDSADCDPELPLVAYLPREERGLAALTRALKKLRPAGATCHFAANTGPGEYAPRAAAADELGDALKDQLPCTVYCP